LDEKKKLRIVKEGIESEQLQRGRRVESRYSYSARWRRVKSRKKSGELLYVRGGGENWVVIAIDLKRKRGDEDGKICL